MLSKRIVDKLMSKPNVTYVGVGHKIVGGLDTNKAAIVVGVKKKIPENELPRNSLIPMWIGGLQTDVVETGEIRLMEEKKRTEKWRPAPGGVSVGHPSITAGTLGMRLKKYGNYYILSNQHVMAPAGAKVDDVIYQPGVHDGGNENDVIATLERFSTPEAFTPSDCPFARFIVWASNGVARFFNRKTRIPAPVVEVGNKVDYAIAKTTETDAAGQILECGVPGEVVEPFVGMEVKKSGRTTGLTQGKITAIDVTAMVQGEQGIVVYVDQIAMTNMLEGGDSGSVLLTPSNSIVGLCFAGSSTMSLANKMSNVLDAINLY